MNAQARGDCLGSSPSSTTLKDDRMNKHTKEMLEVVSQLSWQVKESEDEGHNGAFFTGISRFVRGLPLDGKCPYQRDGYEAAREALTVIIKRRAQSLARYQQGTLKFK